MKCGAENDNAHLFESQFCLMKLLNITVVRNFIDCVGTNAEIFGV
jgi:hypothetical protein